MKNNHKYKRSLIASLIALSMTVSLPVWAASPEDGKSNENDSSGISMLDSLIGVNGQVIGSNQGQVAGIGAIAGNGNNNTAVGIGVQVGDGFQGKVSGIGAIAGNGNNNTAVGIGVLGGGQFSIGDNMSGQDAKNSTGSYNRVIGTGAQAGNGNNNTALGTGSFAGGGNGLSSLNTAIGAGAQATMGNSVALGANSVTDRPNSVSVGGPLAGDRQITNVAPGYYDTDGVNMSQLRRVDDRVDRVGATAFAFSALAPLPYDSKEPTQYSAGIGTYNGTSAVAVGVYHYTRPDVMLNLAFGMSSSGWEKAARFGISWRTGGAKNKEIAPAIETKPQENSILDRVKKILDDSENQD